MCLYSLQGLAPQGTCPECGRRYSVELVTRERARERLERERAGVLLRERPRTRAWRVAWRVRVLSLAAVLLGVAAVCIWIAFESVWALERKLNAFGVPRGPSKSAVVRVLEWAGDAAVIALHAVPYALLVLTITCAVLGLVTERVPLSRGEPVRGADARGLGWLGLAGSFLIAGCLMAYHLLN